MSDKVSAAITIGLLVLVIGTGAVVHAEIAGDEGFKQTMTQQWAEARAYCDQVYDDPTVYNAMVVGRHGGIHCGNDDHLTHMHDIPQNYVDRAYRAEQAGVDLGWTPATADRHAAEFRANHSWWELNPMWASIPVVAVIVIGVAILLTLFGPKPDESTSEVEES